MRPAPPIEYDSGNYDYVIVGAGSAGCVLADRLTASGRHRVLLIEAGGSDARLAIKVPIGYGFTFSDRRVNWAYRTQADPGLASRSIYWPRGKVIGGCSSINAMAYVRGLPHDFDDWERNGANGWNWAAVRRAFLNLEIFRGFGDQGEPTVRGVGPLCVSDLRDQMHPFSSRFLESARDIGWPVLRSTDDREQEGLTYFCSTVRNGYRVSAADAFLRAALRRPNLRVVANALVTRLSTKDDRLSRVHYRVGGTEHVCEANAEIIVSAGAVNSPQILQLSGIGPQDLLQSHGIPVLRDLKQVGKGLQDHLAISHLYEATEPTLNTVLGRWLGRVGAGLRYAVTRRGALSVPVNQVGGFIRSGGPDSAPDIQIFCNPASYSVSASGKPHMDRKPGYLLSAQPCRPTSRGEIRIASPDPRDAPLIHPNSLATEEDRLGAIRAGKLIRDLLAAPTLRRVTRSTKTPDIRQMTDDDMLDDFRSRASTVFHPCGTCRMGATSATSVVDSRLRVHDIDGLRVVDASTFPNITSGNTNAPTLMLAMRAADMILEDARG
jgi:choline dehydrogenase